MPAASADKATGSVRVIHIADLTRHPRCQGREDGNDESTVIAYAHCLNAASKLIGDKGLLAACPLPPGIVYYDGTTNHLADGFHRTAAAEKLKWTKYLYEVRLGTQEDAILCSTGCNKHGRPSNARDRRRNATVCCLHPYFALRGSDEIALHTGCPIRVVRQIREAINADREGAKQLSLTIQEALDQIEEPLKLAWEAIAKSGGKPVICRAKGGGRRVFDARNVGQGRKKKPESETVTPAEVTEAAHEPSTNGTPVAETNGESDHTEPPFIVPDARDKSEILLDAYETEVPSDLRDVFGDPWVKQAALDFAGLADYIESATRTHLLACRGKGQQYAMWMRSVPLEGGIDVVGGVVKDTVARFRAVAAMLRSATPAVVCPCRGELGPDGQSCTNCRLRCGWMPKWKADEVYHKPEFLTPDLDDDPDLF